MLQFQDFGIGPAFLALVCVEILHVSVHEGDYALLVYSDGRRVADVELLWSCTVYKCTAIDSLLRVGGSHVEGSRFHVIY